ncbi:MULTISPECIES: branched-chain amino acid ABC transporter ATP-binding protein [Yersinia pseudotuberculosis complex]|uniref:Amino acid transporter n=2 Tax=Yersinia pseudotuberculosis complex TaxID=1649845 RepID=A0ABM9TCP6_9GAMM|nr:MULTISPECIES: ABC transporter ATP-binding protein [Yersinia pseudotuberculosis complex]ABS49004.1 putative amino acid ABC transporter, ATP-binding protein [Yersinia pseudotuberculosis IP 31758]MCE4111936.1 ABC transporter ATP-binding protein [Yersinia pseudotuberculosis]MCF1162172.1 ABC transporter ATP-binding protein [Yersinia pseudotuberculosis]RYC27890.1 ABC transporter ATP-binding protein [Yersinia pseudotuberculosis]UFA62516.1 High-affinity branched-chain amino acid ABC transporter ATP
MLSLTAVNQYYGNNHILWDINLELPRGQCTCLIGRNGVGKTTLINCIMGHLPIKSGTMIWQPHHEPPQNLQLQPVERRNALGIGYVPQGQQIFSQLSVEDNLLVAVLAGRHKSHPIPGWVFELFPLLHDKRSQRGGELTRNQQQQLAIARALVAEPELLILDEPGSGTSPALSEDISTILHQLSRNLGMTLLLVEHRLPFIQHIADRFCLMAGGRNVAQGTLDQLNEGLISEHLAR